MRWTRDGNWQRGDGGDPAGQQRRADLVSGHSAVGNRGHGHVCGEGPQDAVNLPSKSINAAFELQRGLSRRCRDGW